MKKIFIFGLIAAALGFTACSNEDDLSVNNQNNHKGMVLRAAVEQPAESRATFTDNEGVWQFAFAVGDNVSVNNIDIVPYFYTFTNEGTEFKCEEAKVAESEITWHAYFPSNEIDLTNQSGTKADVANKYALAGATASATTGEGGLNITMSPKVAILVIDNQKGAIDINVKNGASTWVKGLTANDNGFNVTTDGSKQTLLSATEKGTYYIAVPAGKQIAVKDGNKVIKSTGESGLTAGKYYNLTIAPVVTKGKAYATGPNCDVNWIQLWAGGPKFAEYNIGTTEDLKQGNLMTFYDAIKTGDNYAWGANWRTPRQDEMDELCAASHGNSDAKVTCERVIVDGINGFIFTGKEAGYTGNQVFFPADKSDINKSLSDPVTSHYWTCTYDATVQVLYLASTPGYAAWNSSAKGYNDYYVRPVLNEAK